MARLGIKKSVLSAVYVLAGAFVPVAAIAAESETSPRTFVPGEESCRLSFELRSPRRFASRFDAAKRLLEVRVSPARASEFDPSAYYDTRYIHRVVLTEENGEVVLGLQLKDAPVGWLVTHQEDPWRIVVDIWRTEPPAAASLEESWRWHEDSFGLPQARSAAALRSSRTANVVANTVPTQRIDVPNAEVAHLPLLAQEGGNREQPNRALTSSGTFGRLDEVVKSSPATMAELQRKAGESLGTLEEFDRNALLAEELYKAGMHTQAVSVYRRLVSLSEVRFKENPKNLWLAGESAYLAQNWDLASDYLRSVLLHFPNGEYASLARLRLNDMELQNAAKQTDVKNTEALYSSYADIALSEKSSWQAKVAATVRILEVNIEQRPESAKLYQQNLNACVNRALVPFEMRKKCAYIQTRYLVEKLDVLSADEEIQKFRKYARDDAQANAFEERIVKSVRAFLEECYRNKKWEAWTNFERKARAPLLDFSLKDSAMVFARAEIWEAVGEYRNAARLYGLYWQMSKDDAKKNEAAAVAARIFQKLGDSGKTAVFLRRIDENEARKGAGLSDRAMGALRTISLPPYRNRTALRILLDEMGAGRFVERELSALTEYARMMRGKPVLDQICEKILAYPAKTQDEIATVESAIMQYAKDLGDKGSFAKSADMFFAVANVAKGTKRGEAAYKAGIMYARAGLLEKAKTSWQMAAGDLSDKRYSALASERLDRIR